MTSDQISECVLRGAVLTDGSRADVWLSDGVILDVRASGLGYQVGDGHATGGGSEIDLTGYLLLPAPAEPHAHLDKALLATRVRNETEDLNGAIEAIQLAYASMDDDDIARRGLEAVKQAVLRGFTAVRTHVDCGAGIGSRSVQVLAALKEQVRSTVDLQIVALAGRLTDDEGAENRSLLAESLEYGADLVGGCPSLEPDPERALIEFLAIADDHRTGLDLHVDETIQASTLVLSRLAEQVLERGFDRPVTASHCVSLGMQDPQTIRETARRVAEAGIGIVTLPQTNLYLQSRDVPTAKPRGLTAIAALREAGAIVAGGSDNWRDPFNPMGRIDAMETASLLVSAGHLFVSTAYDSVSRDARTVMGLPPVSIAAGSAAELMAVKGESLSDAVARASEQRMVFKNGRLIAHTTIETPVAPQIGSDKPGTAK